MDFAKVQKVLFELRNQKAEIVENDAFTRADMIQAAIDVIDAFRDEYILLGDARRLQDALKGLSQNPAFERVNAIVEEAKTWPDPEDRMYFYSHRKAG